MDALLREVLSFLYIGTVGQRAPEAEPFFVWLAGTDRMRLYCECTDRNRQDSSSAFIPLCLSPAPTLRDGKRTVGQLWAARLDFLLPADLFFFSCE